MISFSSNLIVKFTRVLNLDRALHHYVLLSYYFMSSILSWIMCDLITRLSWMFVLSFTSIYVVYTTVPLKSWTWSVRILTVCSWIRLTASKGINLFLIISSTDFILFNRLLFICLRVLLYWFLYCLTCIIRGCVYFSLIFIWTVVIASLVLIEWLRRVLVSSLNWLSYCFNTTLVRTPVDIGIYQSLGLLQQVYQY